MKRVGAGWDELSEGVEKFGHQIDALGSRLVGLGMGAAFAGGVAAVGAVTYGVLTLNREAENAAISIGTIFSVNGLAANVPAGMTMAKDTIAEMRKDVQALPVEFRDLQNVFKTAAIPMFHAGATPEQAEKLAVKASAAGASMDMDQSMVAREFGMLLSGRAGAHNAFGTNLGFFGDKAKEINAADPAKRMEMVSVELNKYAGAIDAFKTSFQGMETTMIDHGKGFARLATAPVFEEVKDTMREINEWFGKNQDAVNMFASHLGNDIRLAFLGGKHEIEEWWPLIENFAGTAESRLEGIWDKVEPYAQSFAASMKEALADPNGTIDKLEDLLTLYPNRETFVLRHGQALEPAPLSMEQQAYARACVERAGLKPTMGQCFRNARQTLELGDTERRLAYVEGFCGKGTHHGWLLLDGQLVDLTLRSLQVGLALHVPKSLKWLGAPDRAERVYFGVPITRDGVPAEIWRSAFGLIEWADDYQPTTLRDKRGSNA
ncbi:MAG TPA: hypothetical protein VHW01_29710 [Polyangiaceae bacterium]|nr:hypothetical protein [Polyangiaceae bacterium]